MPTKKAIKWVLFWVTLALLFNAGIFFIEGQEKAMQFLGGYVIELSLSVDNLFLFLLIFSCFGIPPKNQRRVLNYGIFGAVVLRFIFIFLGISVVNRFHWVLYVFGVLLLYSGFKMFLPQDECTDLRDSRVLKIMRRFIPVTDGLHGEKFLVRIDKVLHATPLLAILVLIEVSDLMFAIDSIPAVFSITTDPFIVYSSNIFAILGLRNLYFVLERLHDSFCYVKYGVALILVFTGVKLSVLYFSIDIPLWFSLVTIFTIIVLSIIFSLVFPVKTGVKCKNS